MQHKLGKTVFVKESYDMLKKKIDLQRPKTKEDNVPGMGLWGSNLPKSQIQKSTPK